MAIDLGWIGPKSKPPRTQVQPVSVAAGRTARLLFAAWPLLYAGAVAAQPSGRAGDVEAAADYEIELTSLLQEAVADGGLVRYDLLRTDLRARLRRVLKAVEDFDVRALRTDAERQAFWFNAYNVQMLWSVVETPTLRNVISDGRSEAFFDAPFLTAGQALTLNDIEHGILRRRGGGVLEALQPSTLDARLHVALNCAAVSCPVLRRRAFSAPTLDEELGAAMRDFAAGRAHFRVEGLRVIVSSLLDWYGEDFDAHGAPAGDFVLRYMPEDRPGYETLRSALAGRTSEALRASNDVSFEYLWDLNAAQ